MPQPQEDQLTQSQLKLLLRELHVFKESFLYQHYLSHFQLLFDDTVDRVIEEPLKSSETLYTREAWIGEARTAKLMIGWFEVLQSESEKALQEIENN